MTDTAILHSAAHAISTAVMILRGEIQPMQDFLDEPRRDDSASKASHAMLDPIFKSAIAFVKAQDEALAKTKDALGKVNK